jgi:hypothetical protein
MFTSTKGPRPPPGFVPKQAEAKPVERLGLVRIMLLGIFYFPQMML